MYVDQATSTYTRCPACLADRACEDPAQADAVPARPPRRLPGQDQAQ